MTSKAKFKVLLTTTYVVGEGINCLSCGVTTTLVEFDDKDEAENITKAINMELRNDNPTTRALMLCTSTPSR